MLQLKNFFVFVDSGFWTYDNVKYYLSGVDDSNLIILDLYSEILPEYQDYDSFFGKGFIWNTCFVLNKI